MKRADGRIARLSSGASQRGVALAIVVWFLAAMSLLVAGIVLQARMDIKLAQVHASRAQIEAAADGAIQLALANLLMLEQQGEYSDSAVHSTLEQVGEQRVAVSFTPVSGLVDINLAYMGLLDLLFLRVEGIDEKAAQELAIRVVEWRSAISTQDGSGGKDPDSYEAIDTAGFGSDSAGGEGDRDVRHGEFEAIEDLLLVPGIDRRIFEAVKDSICVSPAGQSGVDWAQAPVSVLQALGDMEVDDAFDLAVSRMDYSEDLIPPDNMQLEFQQAGSVPVFRVDALVESDGSVYLRRRWVDRSRIGIDGLPWLFFRTDELVVASGVAAQFLSAVEDVHVGS